MRNCHFSIQIAEVVKQCEFAIIWTHYDKYAHIRTDIQGHLDYVHIMAAKL